MIRTVLLLLTIGLCMASEIDPRLTTALEKLDAQFNTCYTWWGKVYDAESGGCYYSLSGKALRQGGNKKFGPDIEATNKIVNVLIWGDLLEQAPQEFKDGVISYMQKRQDPDSGFFRDPEFAKSYGPKTLNRAVGMASTSIKNCGGKPLYPLPLERVGENKEAQAHYAHLENVESLRKWLDALPWKDRIWTCGSSIRAQSGIFQSLEEPRRGLLLDEVERYFKSKQAADGYYGNSKDDEWYSRLSGTYKAVSTFEANGRTVPMVDTLIGTVMNDLRTQNYTNLIVLYNTSNILAILNRNGGNFSTELRIEIVERSNKILEKFKHKDGGFITDTQRARHTANGKHLGKKGVIESNTNSTGLAHKTRGLLREIAIGDLGPYSHPNGQDLIDALIGAHK